MKPPSGLLLLLEVRALLELGTYFAAQRLLTRISPKNSPRGHHPVLVIPGFGTSDTMTVPLRQFLTDLGYAAHGWEQGMNLGMNPAVRARLLERVAQLHQTYGAKISLVGHSLGGVFARELAKKIPQDIRQVITLGSPIAGPPGANNIERVYHFFNPRKHEHVDLHVLQRRRAPPPVPITSIYSRSDGIVAWQCALEKESPLAENIAVHGSHSGLCFNPLALYVLANRLSQPENHWKPFERVQLEKLLFPDPGH
ncbi:MAG: alpha/beta fold hydrolase [Rhodoferax sp.]|nr:alpha/beta fold hydrolase [Rhodoferax sp.]